MSWSTISPDASPAAHRTVTGLSDISLLKDLPMLKIVIVIIAVMALGALFSGCVTSCGVSPLETVAHVDLGRYVGTWHEIARYPNSFQKGCIGSTATYTLREDGEIDVVNRCRDLRDGSLREAKGRAWVVDPTSNARLKVSFFWPFRGDYWIIDLGNDYEFAVVGAPSRKYLWVLSRTPLMDDDVYNGIMQRIEQLGFDRDRVVKSAQQ
jgi:apolipoprotein D and lipocalin family protein